jgi:site-specific DNA-methyltransferase (adenine-specific)
MENERGTRTSSFGSPGRESHDSSHFYSSRMYQEHLEEDTSSPYIENPISGEYLDTLIHASSTDMHQLPDSCLHLMVTSPPYNVRKDYDEDLTLNEYLTLLRNVFQETYRVLVPGGRACINIANLGRKPYIPLNGYISQIMTEIGFLMRGEIIWDKAASSGSSTAWGSWKSASNPTLRDVHEYILVFSKMRFSRDKVERDSTINRDEFLEYSKSIWSFQTESAKNVGHPAPFPEELPYRLIQLYTFEDEVVLDPFIGSGTTAVACIKTNRHFVGYDTDEGYLKIAKKRLKAARNKQLKLF